PEAGGPDALVAESGLSDAASAIDSGPEAAADGGSDAGAGDASLGPNFVYVASDTSPVGIVAGYAFNPATAVLTPLPGAPFSTGTNPRFVCADPSGKFLYVAAGSQYVYGYAINPSTGALTAVPSSPFAAGTPATGVEWIAVDPVGPFLYATNANLNQVFAFTLDGASGTLGAIGSALSTGQDPDGVAIDLQGKRLYIANFVDNTVSLYAIGPSTGALTAVGTYAVGMSPRAVAVSPTGAVLYVANSGDSAVAGYALDSATGALTSATPAFSVANLADPTSIAIDPMGRFLYVADGAGSAVSAFAISAGTGALTSVGAPFTAGTYPEAVAVDALGKVAFVANRGVTMAQGSVSAFAITASSGALVPAAGSPFVIGQYALSVAAVKTY
ncbi:MAG: lactonase family protein, partial [Polyangiaceae bacterium]